MKILVAGDFHQGGEKSRVKQLTERGEYKTLFEQVKPFVQGVDYSVVNFESPVVNGEVEPIKKIGPNLKCNRKAIEAMQYIGFDCFTLANNHFYDYGEQGVIDTIEACREKGIDIVGGGRNINQAKQTLYKDVDGKKVAFVNFCENEWSIATEQTGGSAPLDIIENYKSITEARKYADYVIVIVHGGKEYYQLPTPKMQKTYRFFIDSGADVVINHHQHCYSGYEQYQGKFIFYGLGNFCFDSTTLRHSIWNDGYLLKLDFSDNIIFELIPYKQCDEQAGVFPMEGEERVKFFEHVERLNAIISNEKLLSEEFEKRALKDKFILNIFEPYSNRYLFALYVRKLLPSFLSSKKRRQILSFTRCETHREVIFKLLEKHLN